MTTQKFPTNLAITDKLSTMTPTQQRLLRELAENYRAMNDSSDRVKKSIIACIDAGITYGMMQSQVGISREALYRMGKRFKDRLSRRKG